MDALQLQDVFQPYYAGRPGQPTPSDETLEAMSAPREAAGGHHDEIRSRLERCRARLANAIAADAGR
jgi:hypothetical protein